MIQNAGQVQQNYEHSCLFRISRYPTGSVANVQDLMTQAFSHSRPLKDLYRDSQLTMAHGSF